MISEDIYARLDPAYTDGDEVLHVLADALSPPLQIAHDALEDLKNRFNPTMTLDSWLSWLLEQIGWPVDDTWPVYTKREILKKVGGWRINYGKPGVIEEIVHTYFTPSSTVAGLSVQIRTRTEVIGDQFIGKMYIGKTYIWQQHSRNELRVIVTSAGGVPYTPDTTARLRRLLEELIPPWMTFEIVPPS